MSIIFDANNTRQLLIDLRQANTEAAKKERLAIYLTKTFVNDLAAQKFIEQMALGAERSIINIPRGSSESRGRADTQTTTLIIEWEKDLNRTGEHAVDQLKEYLAGNWKSGEKYEFTLITTDGIIWKIYAPDWSALDDAILNLGSSFDLREIRNFELTESNLDEFPFFLDTTLFVTELKRATLENILKDFGDTSNAFINSREALISCLKEIEKSSELSVAMEQWRSFLSIAYGKYDASPQKFLVHTYLSVLSKLIAFSVLSHEEVTDEAVLHGILDGTEFNKYNVERFVENDFFFWVLKEPYFRKLTPMFRAIIRALADYDLSNIQEDVLKGVYQELIDLDTRHALGEYYTPDWLCEKVVSELRLPVGIRILDPACGSGSFLRVCLDKIKKENPKIAADEIVKCVHGIDIHPLSVQITKTTLLLAIGDRLHTAQSPVVFNIFLANSLLVPSGTADLFLNRLTVTVDNRQHDIDLSGISDANSFDAAIDLCDELIKPKKEPLKLKDFRDVFQPNLPKNTSPTLIEELYQIYLSMKRAVDENRNSIWKFVLQNSYKPIFLRGYFDIVIGNPPWLTYSSIENASYQVILSRLAKAYRVLPERATNMPHLEIAAIFMAHACNYFLKPEGRLAFVLPRSFLSADQHDNTRKGVVNGLQLEAVWDLVNVTPLFRVPSCVLWARCRMLKRENDSNISGLTFSGKLPGAQISWVTAEPRLSITPVNWTYSELGSSKTRKKSALTTNPVNLKGSNAYEELFKQGATILPRSFYFIEPDGPKPEAATIRSSTCAIKSEHLALKEAKSPWKHEFKGRVEGKFLFQTVISKNILPFAINSPPMIVLPVEVAEDKYRILNESELITQKARHAATWFRKTEDYYLGNRTAKAVENNLTMLGRLNYQRGITLQEPNFDWLVLYTSSSKDASAAVVSKDDFDLPFICDHKAYWFTTNSEDEAHYVCAYLNANRTNRLIKDYQSRGLMGARDIHKTILMVPFAKFDKNKRDHMELSGLSRLCATKAYKIAEKFKEANLDMSKLGRARLEIRSAVENELKSIDAVLDRINAISNHVSISEKPKRKKSTKKIKDLFE